MKRFWILVSLYLFLLGCSKESQTSSFTWQTIEGRDEDHLKRSPVYRAKAPSNWQRKNPSSTDSITDTTKALCEFYIQDREGTIRLTVHHFPSMTLAERIPPRAQIQRWQSQFDSIDPATIVIRPQSRGGFAGLFLAGTGFIKGERFSILGWSMQLDADHFRQLSLSDTPLSRQRRADYTIKAIGPSSLMNRYQKDIERFAQSFELIGEIPAPL
jgi:hypothetical protein